MLRRSGPAVVLVPILLLAYSGGLSREFTSEDFLILRRLGSGDFFARAAESVVGAWLGAGFVAFYRPISSLLLQLEWLAFGPNPLPYLLMHLVVHAGTTLLLGAWLRRLLPEAAIGEVFLATLVFALYPLHPNTVLFIASFATLFATFFIVATLYFEAAGRRGLALVVAAMALLSYEQAVVLPGLILLFDIAARPGGWRQRLRLWPYVAMTIAWLALRQTMLGEFGGYGGLGERFADPSRLLQAVADVVSRLFVPVFVVPSGRMLVSVVAAVLAAATAFAIAHRHEAGARLCVAALVAIPLVQAPFFFTTVVPGNGRYVYLASAFAAVVAWQGLRMLPPLIARSALGVAVFVCALGLREVVTVYGVAAQQARAIRSALEAAPAGRLFVVNRPEFVHKWGLPVAQVFHWGLADALQPPFSARTDLDVYPLAEMTGADLSPLLLRPDLGRVVRVDGARLSEARPGSQALPALLETVRDVRTNTGAPFVRVRRLPGTSLRLVVITQGAPSAFTLPEGDEVEAEVPEAIRTSMHKLYGTPMFFWVEARDSRGHLVAVSEIVVS